MLEQLRAWLNGKRDYYAGVALLAEAGSAAPLLAVLKKGPTPFSISKLQSELLAICNQLKAKQNDDVPHANHPTGVHLPNDKTVDKPIPQNGQGNDDQGQAPTNQALFESCRQEALKVYKTAMNDRAILFSQANAFSAEEVNLPHNIEARAKLALAVVRNYKQASQLFDRADHVKQHGRLPDEQDDSTAQPEYDALPDDLVYPTLTNLRKALSKLKKKAQTTERIALQQLHIANIQKLEGRWRLLKGK